MLVDTELNHTQAKCEEKKLHITCKHCCCQDTGYKMKKKKKIRKKNTARVERGSVLQPEEQIKTK